ncbi:aspartate/glutamate racemase family protein [Mangrovicoccus sp. HB161399]|uniref:aspartate/glutamate racemase family protein n=1 Tax=Mangrovicoccus sp. HB161399 TaxID=2720392 RepID=UPI0015539D4E|nr:aspartate/glutamate racemase family protein [Mangrovicoccus sp. HB161399]
MSRPAPFIGILSLDTVFPRIPGDAGNPESYHLPTRVALVEGADPTRIVQDGQPVPDLVEGFIAAARQLEAEGACLITSTCGFLMSVQAEIAASVRVPCLLSGLCLIPLVQAMTGGRPVAVLTASEAALGPRILAAAGTDAGAVRIGGMSESTLFRETFLAPKSAQRRGFDRGEMEAAVLARARRLIAEHPGAGALVLECGNLPPYAGALRQALPVPVFSILDGARMMAPPA